MQNFVAGSSMDVSNFVNHCWFYMVQLDVETSVL